MYQHNDASYAPFTCHGHGPRRWHRIIMLLYVLKGWCASHVASCMHPIATEACVIFCNMIMMRCGSLEIDLFLMVHQEVLHLDNPMSLYGWCCRMIETMRAPSMRHQICSFPL